MEATKLFHWFIAIYLPTIGAYYYMVILHQHFSTMTDSSFICL